jgi:hypothetical protein
MPIVMSESASFNERGSTVKISIITALLRSGVGSRFWSSGSPERFEGFYPVMTDC